MGYNPWGHKESDTTDHRGNNTFNLRNCQIVFQSNCIIKHHQQCMKVPISLQAHRQSLCVFDYSPPGGYEIVSHYSFDLYFSDG